MEARGDDDSTTAETSGVAAPDLELDPEARPRHRAHPATEAAHLALHLVLCGERPLTGGLTIDLGNAREVVIEAGPEAAALRASPLSPGSSSSPSSSSGSPAPLRVTVPDSTLGPEQARLTLSSPTAATLDALPSPGGTWVLGRPTSHSALEDGDWFLVGRSAFTLRRVALNRPVPPGPFVIPHAPELTTFSPALARGFAQAVARAASARPLLLVGGPGTGKKTVAGALHRLSSRDGSLVAVNCATRDPLGDGDLFVGATTILLEEVGALTPAGQGRLAELLDRVAGTEPAPGAEPRPPSAGATGGEAARVWVLAASRHNLAPLVRAGRFRADLLGRLGDLVITLTALADRLEDLGPLIATLLERHAGPEAARFHFTEDACRALLERPWPLNVRELDLALQAAVALAGPTGAIGSWHLSGEHLGPGVRGPLISPPRARPSGTHRPLDPAASPFIPVLPPPHRPR